jgi:hypothetical protein
MYSTEGVLKPFSRKLVEGVFSEVRLQKWPPGRWADLGAPPTLGPGSGVPVPKAHARPSRRNTAALYCHPLAARPSPRSDRAGRRRGNPMQTFTQRRGYEVRSMYISGGLECNLLGLTAYLIL